MGLFGMLFRIVGIVILLAVGIAAYLYFTDYDAKATVTDRGHDAKGDYVVVTPKLVSFYHYTYHFTSDQDKYAPFVCKGYDVEFHVKSHDMRVTDKQGRVVYDSKDGSIGTAALVSCGASNL